MGYEYWRKSVSLKAIGWAVVKILICHWWLIDFIYIAIFDSCFHYGNSLFIINLFLLSFKCLYYHLPVQAHTQYTIGIIGISLAVICISALELTRLVDLSYLFFWILTFVCNLTPNASFLLLFFWFFSFFPPFLVLLFFIFLLCFYWIAVLTPRHEGQWRRLVPAVSIPFLKVRT